MGFPNYQSIQISITLNAITLVPAPDIEIIGNGNMIADGQTTLNSVDNTNFGETTIGSPVTRQFTINNPGTATLTINSISLNDLGFGSGDWSITGPVSTILTSGSTTTFDVTFTPTSLSSTDTQEIEVEIVSDDPDESSFTFNIQVTVLIFSDGDSVANVYDLDDDNDGILDSTEGVGDTDGDGVSDSLDLDSDNDGIFDIVEAGQIDSDGDGMIDGFVDLDANGFHDVLENPELYAQDNAASTFTEINGSGAWGVSGVTIVSDASEQQNGLYSLKLTGSGPGTFERGEYDFPVIAGTIYNIKIWAKQGLGSTQVFSDWVGFSDGPIEEPLTTSDWKLYEWNVTANITGTAIIRCYVTYATPEFGNELFLDQISIRELQTQILPNNDGDTFVNYLDLDSDGDGIPDNIEAQQTIGYVSPNGVYNSSGIDTAYLTGLTPVNTDGIDTVDYLDLDSDNEGGNDTAEAVLTLAGTVGTNGLDTNSETADNYLDVNGIFDDPQNDFPDTDLDIPYGGDVDHRDALFNIDSDSDLVPDSADLDDDNDGILDVDESGGVNPDTDADGDGVPLYLDDDDGNAAVGDVNGLIESGFDLDGDGIANHLDLDADGDEVFDIYESGHNALDANSDGIIDGVSADFGFNGLYSTLESDDTLAATVNYTLTNTDGDPAFDFLDVDDDGDGVNTIFEGPNPDGDLNPNTGTTQDTDGDTIPDYLDIDDDEDGINTIDENDNSDGDGNPNTNPLDSDGDTFYNYLDLDSDNDGIPDTDELLGDLDGDSVPNYIDLDSDNDGIYDVTEAGQDSFDSDNDGIIDTLISVGTNGLFDGLETFPDSGIRDLTNFPISDSDGDTFIDAYELDADNDLCNDVTEAGYTDGDGDGILGTSPAATDAQGRVTSGIDGYTTPDDVDSNGTFDFQEFDVTTAISVQPVTPPATLIGGTVNIDVTATGNTYQWQVSTAGIGGPYSNISDVNPNYSGTQTANLVISNVPLSFDGNFYQVIVSTNNYACDTPITSDAVQITIQLDSDGDLIPDVTDLDDDNDGIPDVDEIAGGIAIDFDGDGIINSLDLDSDNDGIFDIVESGQLNGIDVLDADNDGRIDGADATTVGTNGLFDLIETDDTGAATVTQPTADSDTDGITDSNELDADNDTCFDVVEAGFGAEDSDSNGRLGADVSLTVDANGVVDTVGLTLGYTTPNDIGNNGIFDFQEFGIGVQPITTQPVDQVIVINANANFNTDLQNTITYQWQESTDGGLNWSNITNGGANPVYSGATTESLTLTTVPLTYNGFQYRVILSSPAFACDVNQISNAALLTVDTDFDGDGVGDNLDLDDDNDGVPDLQEYDSIDPFADVDGDGVPAYLDDNDNNFSVGDDNNAVETAFDLDGDGDANHLDLDADGDGLFDVNEAGHSFLDTDGDGFIDGATTGSGLNGLFDGVETTPEVDPTLNYIITDFDGDGNENFLDADDDNDGVATSNENADPNGDGNPSDAVNTDGDGQQNYLDIDDDGDGILTSLEGTSNPDGDGRANYLDLDSDNDGITDNVEGQTTAGYITPTDLDDDNDGLDNAYEATNGIQTSGVNTDSSSPFGDATPDYLDLDSDGDTVPDSIEGHDIDQDGLPDVTPIGDTDNDGLDDAYDGSVGDYADPNGSIVTTDPATDLPDTDGTEDVNYRDLDDDGDGVHTRYEEPDPNGDGDFSDSQNTDASTGDTTPDYLDNDDDGDGILTADENPDPNGDGNPADAQDTDADGIPDYLDDDDDNDGISTGEEGNGDTDGDGRADYLDIDDDGDGIMTITEGDFSTDEDSDGRPNHLDLDSDDDGIPDNVEGQTTADYELPSDLDDDNDGLDNTYDSFSNTNQSNYSSDNGIQADDVNTDGSSNPDYLDGDSDDDGVLDSIEGHDYDADGVPDNQPIGDSDDDGLDDAYDGSIGDYADPNGLSVVNDPATDLPNRDLDLAGDINYQDLVQGDAEVDFRDTDDDGDGIPTSEEDTNGNGDWSDDNCDSTDPSDNDPFPDYLDATSCTIVPNGFSPNGDGDNDLFVIPALSLFSNFTIEIYDRWGNIVYDYSNNGRARANIQWWDGFSTGSRTIKKGQKVPVGTYFYVIEFNEGGRGPEKGWVYVNY